MRSHLCTSFLIALFTFTAAQSSICNAQELFDHIPKAPADFSRLLQRARAGDPQAQFLAGLAYDTGAGVERNYEEAAMWYQKAADHGNAGAQANLGFMYSVGRGVPPDVKEALKWYHKAAKNNFPTAEFDLGQLYWDGSGVPRDFAAAVRWYRKAAEHGDAAAESQLGYAYSHGQGVTRDMTEAEHWYRLAATDGSPTGQHNLAVLLSRRANSAAAVAQSSANEHPQPPAISLFDDDIPTARFSLFGRKR